MTVESSPASATPRLRLGVIGSAGRGGLARRAHDLIDGVAVTMCCDISDEALAQNREWYGDDIGTTHEYRELLDADVDAVFVCSPDYLHEEHAVAALETGRPVFCEKPLAITIEGCDRILGASRENGNRLFVGHNMRYMNIFRKMKSLIADGAIGVVKSAWCRHFISYGGDAYFRDWHSERRFSTSLLLQKGAHDIDMLHWLTGATTLRVSAFGNLAVYGDLPRREPEEIGDSSFNASHWPPMEQSGFSPVIDVEDQSTVIMQMTSGILGSYLQCHFSPDACRNYTIIGSAGRIENFGDSPDSPIYLWNTRHDRYRLEPDHTFYGDTVEEGSHGGADPLIVADFIDFVRSGISNGATPEDARLAVAVGCRATESLRAGGTPLDVPPSAA